MGKKSLECGGRGTACRGLLWSDLLREPLSQFHRKRGLEHWGGRAWSRSLQLAERDRENTKKEEGGGGPQGGDQSGGGKKKGPVNSWQHKHNRSSLAELRHPRTTGPKSGGMEAYKEKSLREEGGRVVSLKGNGGGHEAS